MVGMEAHGGGSRPLDGAAAPLPVLLPVIPVGSLGSGRGQNREEALVCFQAVLRRATFRQPCQEHEAVRFARWNPPVDIPKRSQPPTSASSAKQRLSSAQNFFRYSSRCTKKQLFFKTRPLLICHIINPTPSNTAIFSKHC